MIHHCFAGCDACDFCGRCRNVAPYPFGGCACGHGGPGVRRTAPDKGPPRAGRVAHGPGPLTMLASRRKAKRVLIDQ